MKTKYLFGLIIVILFTAIRLQAQDVNRIYIPDVMVGAGGKTQLEVCVQNTAKNITGMQFNLSLPYYVNVDLKNATLTERFSKHKAVFQNNNQGQGVVMVYSQDNTVLSNKDGVVMTIPITVSSEVKPGTSFDIELTKVVLSDNLGNNVLTESNVGKIKIVPRLTLTAQSRELNEGEKMLFTITNEVAPVEPLTISISSEMSGRLKFPSTVTMEANTTTATFEVEAIDNTEVSETLTVAVKVSAEEHEDGEYLILIIDDDMPDLELIIKPETINESSGINAAIGKIVRKSNINKKVKITKVSQVAIALHNLT